MCFSSHTLFLTDVNFIFDRQNQTQLTNVEVEQETLKNEIYDMKQDLIKLMNEINHPVKQSNSQHNFIKMNNMNHQFKIPSKFNEQMPDLVLLVNAAGRGGSSWMGELLTAAKDKIMYVYEPLSAVAVVINKTLPSYITEDVLTQSFTCQFREEHFDKSNLWNFIFKLAPGNCTSDCYKVPAMRQRCRLADTIVVKVSPNFKVMSNKINNSH